MSNILVINSKENIIFAEQLERISRTALPNIVSKVLNKAAMDVKKGISDNNKNPFIHRNETFFKASSSIEFVKGRDITTMRSIVGFKSNPKRETRNDYSVQDLEQQEYGGKIAGKAFIPTVFARRSKNYKKQVRGAFRLTKIQEKIINAKNAYHKARVKTMTKERAFILSAIYAKKSGNTFVISKNKDDKEYLFSINSVKRVGKNTKINSTPIYSVQAKRSITPSKGAHLHFMRKESMEHAEDMNGYFQLLAKERIKQRKVS